jgi:hypothetical protein
VDPFASATVFVNSPGPTVIHSPAPTSVPVPCTANDGCTCQRPSSRATAVTKNA